MIKMFRFVLVWFRRNVKEQIGNKIRTLLVKICVYCFLMLIEKIEARAKLF